MALRKPIDEAEARLALVNKMTGLLQDSNGVDLEEADTVAERIADEFRTAEFEVTHAKVAGETVIMRRLVLTGEWEVTETTD